MELATHQQPLHHVITLDHVIAHCLYIDHFVCIICYRIEVEPEPEITPFVEDPDTEPQQQGKQTPIDHVDKIPLPSQSLLGMIRMITMLHFYRIDEPIPLH